MKKDYAKQAKDPKWQKMRLEVMERDNFRCVSCGDRKNMLSVHHGYYIDNRDIWDYDTSILVTLCAECHSDYHQHSFYRYMKQENYLFWLVSLDETIDEWYSRSEYSKIVSEIIRNRGNNWRDVEPTDNLFTAYDIVQKAIEKKIEPVYLRTFGFECIASNALISNIQGENK